MARGHHPLEAARRSLDDAVPLLTGDPTTTAKVFVEKETAEREKLEQLTDKELLVQAVREIAIIGILISRALQRQVDALIPTKVGEIAVLVRSLAASLRAVTVGFKQAADMQTRSPRGGEPQGGKSASDKLSA